MQKTVDYWSTFYEEENAAPSADPAIFSNSILASTSQRQSILEQVESQPSPSMSNISLQPQASSSYERPQVSNFAPTSRPQDNFAFNSQSGGEMHTETSLVGWHRSNGAGSANQTGATFNVTIKPRNPPAFHGRATDDVITWLSKVEDFFYLTGATPQQQVAYTATLLLDAAGGLAC